MGNRRWRVTNFLNNYFYFSNDLNQRHRLRSLSEFDLSIWFSWFRCENKDDCFDRLPWGHYVPHGPYRHLVLTKPENTTFSNRTMSRHKNSWQPFFKITNIDCIVCLLSQQLKSSPDDNAFGVDIRPPISRTWKTIIDGLNFLSHSNLPKM